VERIFVAHVAAAAFSSSPNRMLENYGAALLDSVALSSRLTHWAKVSCLELECY